MVTRAVHSQVARPIQTTAHTTDTAMHSSVNPDGGLSVGIARTGQSIPADAPTPSP